MLMNLLCFIPDLLAGALDDGRGRARVGLFRHKHEIETGRTSSVGMEVWNFHCLSVLIFSFYFYYFLVRSWVLARQALQYYHTR